MARPYTDYYGERSLNKRKLAFIESENIRWFKQQLQVLTDEEAREQLQRLLNAAEAQLREITDS